MKYIKKILLFIKNLFNKKDEVKMLIESEKSNEKVNSINSLSVEITEKRKRKKIETMTCFGDGLGIQTKINF